MVPLFYENVLLSFIFYVFFVSLLIFFAFLFFVCFSTFYPYNIIYLNLDMKQSQIIFFFLGDL